eukprot:gene815-729_t
MSYQGPDFRSGNIVESYNPGDVGDFHNLSFSWFLLFVLVVPPVLCVGYAVMELLWIKSIKLAGEDGRKMERIEQMHLQLDGANQNCLFEMRRIADAIAVGANAYMDEQSKYLMYYMIGAAVIITPMCGLACTFCVFVGGITSIICGYIGMKVAVFTNVRTSFEAWQSLKRGFFVALRGGSVIGFCIVGFALINLLLVYMFISSSMMSSFFGLKTTADLFEALCGYGLGASSIALFARVGGGIYTKAADVGADLAGKVENGMDEDDVRNPACIADNVGDNVGDIAGMGADLFGSFAEATCAALMVASASPGLTQSMAALMYPLVISSLGMLAGLVTIIFVRCSYDIELDQDIEKTLKATLTISTGIATPLIMIATGACLPDKFAVSPTQQVHAFNIGLCAITGLWAGLGIGFVTEYYTSHSYEPVREVAESQKTAAATGIIFGLALGYQSTIIPGFFAAPVGAVDAAVFEVSEGAVCHYSVYDNAWVPPLALSTTTTALLKRCAHPLLPCCVLGAGGTALHYAALTNGAALHYAALTNRTTHWPPARDMRSLGRRSTTIVDALGDSKAILDAAKPGKFIAKKQGCKCTCSARGRGPKRHKDVLGTSKAKHIAAAGVPPNFAAGQSLRAALAFTLLVSHSLGGMYGIAIAALGMLATLTIGLTIDCYGPISDNAGGIVEMSGMGSETRQRTDALDAAGNTTAAIGKGFAIGSAALVAMALFGAFCERAKISQVDMLSPWTMFGTMLGTVLPFAFSAVTMKAVGMAANDMVEECRRQFPLILNGSNQPDYETCIKISTQASFREMFKAGGMVLLAPTVGGVMFGKNFTAGLLTGSLYCGVCFAICMSNSGGAWDNAKKYIEAGGLGHEHLKGSESHKNAVVGDTVGDPLKDTSGPSLNILVKLGAIMSLVFADTILHCSNITGGPAWSF